MFIVDLSFVRKTFKRLPHYIVDRVQIWANQVESEGLLTIQKIPGYRDHGLKANRKGQRSLYLNKQWRLIYTLNKKSELTIVKVEEITPHAY